MSIQTSGSDFPTVAGQGGPADGAAPDAVLPVRAALIFYTVLGAVAFAWIGWDGRLLGFASAEAAQRGVRWLPDAALGLGVGAALVAASRALSERSAAGRALSDALAELIGRPSLGVCLLLAALSGLAEEAFFRAALQPHAGLVVASLCFGLAHFVPRRAFLPWPVFAVVAGLGFGWLFETTGNLLAPALAHAFVNALNLRWLAARGGSGSDA